MPTSCPGRPLRRIKEQIIILPSSMSRCCRTILECVRSRRWCRRCCGCRRAGSIAPVRRCAGHKIRHPFRPEAAALQALVSELLRLALCSYQHARDAAATPLERALKVSAAVVLRGGPSESFLQYVDNNHQDIKQNP